MAVAGAAGVVAAVAVATAGPAPAGAPAVPESFAFAIGNHTLDGNAEAVGQRYKDFDLVVVDGEEATEADVEAIQAEGTEVLAYLSVGTIEKWRKLYPRLKAYRLSAWQDWKDEWFADTSKAGLRNELAEIAEGEILSEGFDGLFLDNADMVENAGHRKQREGMGKLIADLDALVGDGLLFTQNGGPGMLNGYPHEDVDPLMSHVDGWNREDVTWTYDFDRREYVRNRRADREDALEELSKIGDAGLVTTATDYVELDDGLNPGECKAVDKAVSVGALPYLADIGLTKKAVEANPPDCP